VDLVTNHRCPPEVVRRAARLVAHGVERFEKRIEPSPRGEGILVLAPDPGDPLARARTLIGRWLGARSGGHAVLARTNAELAPFAATALEQGIPWTADDDGLALDDPGLDTLLEAAARVGPDGRPAGLVAMDARSGVDVPAGDGEEPGPAGTHPARVLLAWGGRDDDPAGLARMLAAARARRAALAQQEPRLVLATVHGTKGLEFDHVAVIGLDEGTFPSRRSIEDAPDPARALEEERRLAYVAWTRARRSLTLVYDPFAPSRFMLEAFEPEELTPPRRAGSRTGVTA
jgi:superfamily I DNA/RNA helicase